MSRTFRTGRLALKQGRRILVREGVHQYNAGGCKHHGSCAYCREGRTFSQRRQQPVEEYNDHRNSD